MSKAKTNTMYISFVPKHKPGDILYAVSLQNDSIYNKEEAKKVEEWNRDYARIYKVKVTAISIDSDGVSYWVSNLNDKLEWGDSIPENQVSIQPEELLSFLVNRWRL